MPPHDSPSWQVQDRFLELHSRWLTLIGEQWQDAEGQQVEYWRIEKADSVIILPLLGHEAIAPDPPQIILPSASYRPGVGALTLDFPGGRVLEGQTPEEAAIATLTRELGIDTASITQLIPLNTEGWAVNSSFSNQKLYGFVAHIGAGNPLPSPVPSAAIVYPANSNGIHQLLRDLTCLQCRAVLLEWYCYRREPADLGS